MTSRQGNGAATSPADRPKHPPRHFLFKTLSGWRIAASPSATDVEYLSVEEHEALLREARAEVFDEVVAICGQHWSVYKIKFLFEQKAKDAREGNENK